MRRISLKEALEILKKNDCPENVINHCKVVAREARKIAEKIKANGVPVDVDFVESAAMLHDVGRGRTHSITHCIEGGKILKDYPEYARVCERHIGAGITKDEAVKLGMPAKDYLPETIEEKIVAHADNLVGEDEVEGIEKAIEKVSKTLGKDHPAVERIRKLDEYIKKLMK